MERHVVPREAYEKERPEIMAEKRPGVETDEEYKKSMAKANKKLFAGSEEQQFEKRSDADVQKK